MTGSLVNIDFGGLGPAAQALIEKVSNGCGMLYEPRRIIKKAEADAKAAKIKTLAKLQLDDEIQRRSIERLVHEEVKKQENIESITEKAIHHLDDSATPENIDNDWMTRFLDKAKMISDKEVQETWSKILAGEAKSPGQYSTRTLEILFNLNKKEAELFNTLSSFTWKNIGGHPRPVITNTEHNLYKAAGLSFIDLDHLETIGLVKLNNLTGYQFNAVGVIPTSYNETTLLISLKTDQALPLGQLILTESGNELIKICTPKIIPEFVEHCTEYWKRLGIEFLDESTPLAIRNLFLGPFPN